MKQEVLAQNKSQLAKLMATENITIRHRQITTAKFDLKNRVLHCPIWKEMDGDIYDLLIGHEISHALNTPLEGWHDTLVHDKKRPKLKSFLNVVEDARIEKLIKRKYPGIRKPFAAAYKALFEQDMFKVKKLKGDYSSLKLIDRINLRYKIGIHLNIEFDQEEQKFLDRIDNLETFEEVAQLSRDIYDYQKFKEPPKEKKKQDKKDEKKDGKKEKGQKSKGDGESQPKPKKSEDDSDDSDSNDGDEESDEDGDGDDDTDSDSDGDDSKDKCDSSSGAGGETVEEPDSLTDNAFRQKEQDLLNHFGQGILYLDIPDADLEKIIIPHKTIVNIFELKLKDVLLKTGDPGKRVAAMSYATVTHGLNTAFYSRNRSYINMLIKEFEMRKNANQYSRQLTAKTGELDDKKIARYKMTNDIFRKITTVTKGKSHGMIMFVDLSGSMAYTIRDIFEQVLILVTFCKRVGIPFDVYGFGDLDSYSTFGRKCFSAVNNGFTFDSGTFCLRHLISSTLAGNAYKRAFTMINVIGQLSYADRRDPASNRALNKDNYVVSPAHLGISLGGTPFMETLIASKSIIQKFKSDYRNDIVNVIYLTDGDGNASMDMGYEYASLPDVEKSNTTIGFRDPKTKISVLTEDTNMPYQTALTQLMSLVTGCHHIGYYFGAASDILSKIEDPTPEDRTFLSKNGFIAVPNIGYDNYYYVDRDMMNYRDDLKIAPSSSYAAMGQVFTAHLNRKMNSKLIIKQFAIDVAE